MEQVIAECNWLQQQQQQQQQQQCEWFSFTTKSFTVIFGYLPDPVVAQQVIDWTYRPPPEINQYVVDFLALLKKKKQIWWKKEIEF